MSNKPGAIFGEVALKYWERDLSAIPVKAGTKKPAKSGFFKA